MRISDWSSDVCSSDLLNGPSLRDSKQSPPAQATEAHAGGHGGSPPARDPRDQALGPRLGASEPEFGADAHFSWLFVNAVSCRRPDPNGLAELFVGAVGRPEEMGRVAVRERGVHQV